MDLYLSYLLTSRGTNEGVVPPRTRRALAMRSTDGSNLDVTELDRALEWEWW